MSASDKSPSRKRTGSVWSNRDQLNLLARIASAPDAVALETCIQGAGKHPFHGAKWRAISAARIARGEAICDVHPHGAFVPRIGPRRRLTACGETYSAGFGQNSTGERYVWHGAECWAVDVLMRHGLGRRAAHRIWGLAGSYPHRALPIVEAALRGEIVDPEIDVLQMPPYRSPTGAGVRCTLEGNEADRHDRRASRMCECGGVLFDWGWSCGEGFESISWSCNACDRRYTEYVSKNRLGEIRRRPSHDPRPFHRGRPLLCGEVAA